MAGGIGQRDARLIAVDNAEAMVERCRQVIIEARRQGQDTVEPELVCADIRDVAIADASMVVLNFTLQFIPVAERQALLTRIYRGLAPGGILVLSEKVVFADSHHNDLMIELHHSFKRANGYSELEISRKRNALENVLIPETLDSHRRRLKTIGFGSVDVWFQCFNFASLLAIKEH